MLASAISPVAQGSIVITPSPQATSETIAAQLSMTYFGSSEPNYIDEEVAMPMPDSSQILRAVADSGDGSPFVAITSLSNAIQHVTVSCLGETREASSKQVPLAPNATFIGPACAPNGSETSLPNLDEPRPATDPNHQSSTGIALTSDGAPGSFAAFALQSHRTKEGQFFSSVPFSDPKMLMSPDTVFAGVPVGAADELPGTGYTPEISLANFSSKARRVTITYAATSADAPSAQTLRTVVLPTGTTKSISFPDLHGDPTIQNSFVVSSDGVPGDVLAKIASKSNDGIREVELMGKDEMDTDNGGNHPWSIQNGADATLLLFNPTASAQYFDIILSAGGVTWYNAYHLKPMETKSISIRNLIHDQVKGDKGSTLPKDAQEGQVDWYVPARNAGRGRILETNKTSLMARSFSCGGQVELCSLQVPGGQWIEWGATVTDWDTATPYVCMNQCSGTVLGQGDTGDTYSWSMSGAPQISGSSTNQSVNAYGASVGYGTADVTVSDPYCQLQWSGPAPVTPSLQISGNGTNSIFVGNDPEITSQYGPNLFVATVNPSGGQLSVTSSDANDSFGYYTLSGSPSAVVTTSDQSTSSNDRTLTFTYTVSGDPPAQQVLRVTARQFAYATNGALSNVCSLGYGWEYDLPYTPYTHPDHAAAQPSIGLVGVKVTETFNPSTISCGNITGDGALDDNSQWSDRLEYCSTQPLPVCSSTNTQTWTVGGYQVRQNTLTIANTGLTYTNNGPTQ